MVENNIEQNFSLVNILAKLDNITTEQIVEFKNQLPEESKNSFDRQPEEDKIKYTAIGLMSPEELEQVKTLARSKTQHLAGLHNVRKVLLNMEILTGDIKYQYREKE